ncbi:MAG: DUF6049 family protein [Pseudonocardia sp.]
MILLFLVTPPAGAAAATPGPAPAVLRLDVEEIGPRVVTADGPGVLSVVATLTNTGGTTVAGLAVRAQRGMPLAGVGDVRDALRGDAAADAAASEFVDLPGELAPGASMPVRFAVPLRGEDGLALARPGVYELLLNVNGTPAGAARARLAAVRMLLPVVSLPPADAAPVTVPPTAEPVPFTLLYPISDAPRRLPTVPGEPALLSDDTLASSFAPGGRLYGLVTALAERAPPGSPVRAATCVAVDAELISTAAAMSDGYEVLAPDGRRVPGTGSEAASRWLDLLTTTVRDVCLLAMPWADADLVALTRGHLVDLASGSITDGRAVVGRTLGAAPLAATTWPADGVLDQATLARTVAPLGRTVLLSADAVSGTRERATGVLPLAGADRPQLVVLTDPLIARALAGPVDTPPTVPATEVRPAVIPAGTPSPLSTQDAIGTLAFRARTLEPGPDPLVLAPPHQWGADDTSAGALLTAAGQMISAGLLVPRPLTQTVSAGIPENGARLPAYPLRAGAREVPPEVVATVEGTRASLADLQSAAVEQGSVGVTVADVFGPLQRGLVRPVSAAFRGRVDDATGAATLADDRVQELRAAIRVVEPPSPYALGTKDAPLLLTVANALPIGVRVRIDLASSGGLVVDPIPEQVIPPSGRRQVQVSAEVTRSGQFTVDATVHTPAGGQLGPASRLRVRSTGYGTITVWLTGTAGVLLVVLAARRVRRRLQGENARPTASSTATGTPPPPPPAARPAEELPGEVPPTAATPTRPHPPPGVPSSRP